MQYRTFGKTGERVSVLGFGCMRLPVRAPFQNIDTPAAVRLLHEAVDGGVNYFDTAFFYHRGRSESLVGKAFAGGKRQQVLLATKSPFGGFKFGWEFEKTLETQLRRLQTDYIDFYLLHAVNLKSWQQSALRFDLLSKLQKAREQGKIRHIGFSFHDSFDAFMTVLNGFSDWEFCQIQYNYYDVDYQAGRRGLFEAAKRGLGVAVMEPLRGGKLADVPDSVRAVLPEEHPVRAGLDFVWDHREVSLLLSGMHNAAQLRENLRFADESRPGKFDAAAHAQFTEASRLLHSAARVGCTHCEYCLPCPKGVQIPEVFAQYNQSVMEPDKAKKAYAKLKGDARSCVRCGLCEEKCPQQLPIRELLAKAHETLSEK